MTEQEFEAKHAMKNVKKRHKVYGWVSTIVFPLIGGGLFAFISHFNISASFKWTVASLILFSFLFLAFALNYMFSTFDQIYDEIDANNEYIDAINDCVDTHDDCLDELEEEQDKQAKEIKNLKKEIQELKKIIINI